ncbi:GNAT family N-acetyltransferase [Aminicella lysinilytica]|uniref:GNAT family N-acetyltransferase n=1 Tax=Aminicella lysinilytica TaxID=433323 RepID=UPI002ED277BB
MIEIRERDQSEFEEAMELALKVFMEFDSSDYSDEGVAEYRKCTHDHDYLDKLRIFTAYDGDREVGVIATRNNGSHIAQFYVDGACHRQGIGRMLFEHVWEMCDKGYMTVNASTYAVPVYRALGFRETGGPQVTDGLKYTPMERIDLYYEEKGEGKPLILLHGNNEDSTYFKNQRDHFADKFRVITLDTRGHGRSPRGAAPFTIRQFADDLACFMDRHAIEKANILGFSDGGNIGLIFAMKYPERIGRLIADGANLFPAGVKAWAQGPVTIGYYWTKTFGPWSRAEMFSLMVRDPDIDPSDLAQITAPTLIMAGTGDLIKESHTRLIASSIPEAELAIIRGSHFIARENPAEFNRRVDEFLGEGW